MKRFSNIRSKWIQEGVEINTPTERSLVISCFEELGFSAPVELVDLYSYLDGFDNMDDRLFRLWSLEEIQKENGKESVTNLKKYGLLFGDFLINSHCFRVTESGVVYQDHFSKEKELIQKANSLTEFFQVIEKNSDEVLL